MERGLRHALNLHNLTLIAAKCWFKNSRGDKSIFVQGELSPVQDRELIARKNSVCNLHSTVAVHVRRDGMFDFYYTVKGQFSIGISCRGMRDYHRHHTDY